MFAPGSGAASADSGSPDFTHFDGFWENSHSSDTVDSSSGTWLTALALALQCDDYIQFAGSDDDNSEFGVTNYWPANSDPLTTVTCVQSEENCAGFVPNNGGGPPTVSVRLETGWIPANSPDSEMVILDKSYIPGLEVWFHHACAPGLVNDYCDWSNTMWTATSMSMDTYDSDGLDSCWPNHYNSPFPGKYPSPYDNTNEGHKGIPSPFTALRHWEFVGGATGDTAIHRSLVIRLPATVVKSTNYFPMTGADAGNIGPIPEGAILRLKASVDISGYSTDLQRVLQDLKDYGAVVGEADTSINSAATIELEALYNEGSSWGDLVHRNSLQGIALTSDNFEFVRKGDPRGIPAPGHDYGPTHNQWSQAGMACEADPGA